ncbi:MAG: type IX secretion system outer membrane channel protein PorV [Marinifilaceae bacterium]
MKKNIITAFLLVSGSLAYAQSNEQTKVVSSSLPFLTITPDAVGASMGNSGVATQADAYSIYWNNAKYAFAEKNSGVAASYTRWMPDFHKGQNLYNITGYHKLNSKNVLSIGMRYFTNGDMDMYNDNGDVVKSVSPKEYALELGYSRLLGNHVSIGAVLRYISSDALAGVEEAKKASAFGVDLGVYFNKNYTLCGRDLVWNAGLALANIGTKVDYGTDSKGYQPAMMRLGTSALYDFCDKQTFRLGVELNRMMVSQSAMEKDGSWTVPSGSAVKEILKSFKNDDLFKEINWSLGAEYCYNKMASLRAGYHYQNKEMGDNSFVSVGAGVNILGIGANASYWITTNSESVLKNTLHLSLSYNF